MSRPSSSRSIALALSILAVLGTALYFGVRFAQALPDGPQPVAWDREACAHCHMHVGDPAFSAQLQTTDGQVLNFDDPGCLLKFVAERQLSIHAMYFHALNQDRWLPRDEVAFVPVDQTPMGYGLGAVEQGTEGALSFAAATQRVMGISRTLEGQAHDPQ